MKSLHGYHWFAIGLVTGMAMLAIGCGDDGGGGDVIDSAVPADTAMGPPDGAPGGTDGAPGAIDAAPGSGDAGLDDAGIGPDAAPGVDCGGQVWEPGFECCVTAGGSSCVETGTCTGATIGCDGPEDCGDTEACCGGLETQCAPADTCVVEVCHTSADCQDQTQQCCSFVAGTSSVCLDRCGPP